MEKVTKDILKKAAHNVLLDMSEEEYDAFLKDFNDILDCIHLISEIPGVDEAEPMAFPYPVFASELREDEVKEIITQEQALKNTKSTKDDFIFVPKAGE